jgi:hypothetical protein
MIRLYFTAGTVLLAAAIAVLIWSEPLAPSRLGRAGQPFAVRASENAGSVILEWSRDAQVIRTATGGLLAFEDGGVSHLDKVDAKVLRQGGLEYRRRSQDVLLRLSLLKDQDVIGHASVRLTGALPPAPEPAR